MESLEPRVFIATVGGTVDPILISFAERKPEYAVFVVSEQTRGQVKAIMDVVSRDGLKEPEKIIQVDDAQNFVSCARKIRRELLRYLDETGLPRETPVLADFTGGTKAMSAALASAMSDFNGKFSYVGGDQRTRDGVGTVTPGHEKIKVVSNPSGESVLIRQLVYAFNHFQYLAAEHEACALNERFAKVGSKYYRGLLELSRGFRAWDAFNHGQAIPSLKSAESMLAPYADVLPSFRELYNLIRANRERLEKVKADAEALSKAKYPLNPAYGDYYLRDLLANAARRAANGGYDDAVARLYSAAEKAVKIELARLGVNNSRVSPEIVAKLSPEYKRDFLAGFAPEEEIKLPLRASYELLGELAPENELFKRYRALAADLHGALEHRNKSLLAHGYQAAVEQHYEKLLDLTLRLLNVSKEELPAFPLLSKDVLLNALVLEN